MWTFLRDVLCRCNSCTQWSLRVPLTQYILRLSTNNYLYGSQSATGKLCDSQNRVCSPLHSSILQHQRELKYLEKNPDAAAPPWHPPGLCPALQGGCEGHRLCTSDGSAALLPSGLGDSAVPEPGYPSALQLGLLRALCKAPRDTQTAALGMAEVGLGQAAPVTPHGEPLCSPSAASRPRSQRGAPGVPSLHGASSALQVWYHKLCLTAVCTQTAMRVTAECELNIRVVLFVK